MVEKRLVLKPPISVFQPLVILYLVGIDHFGTLSIVSDPKRVFSIFIHSKDSDIHSKDSEEACLIAAIIYSSKCVHLAF